MRWRSVAKVVRVKIDDITEKHSRFVHDTVIMPQDISETFLRNYFISVGTQENRWDVIYHGPHDWGSILQFSYIRRNRAWFASNKGRRAPSMEKRNEVFFSFFLFLLRLYACFVSNDKWYRKAAYIGKYYTISIVSPGISSCVGKQNLLLTAVHGPKTLLLRGIAGTMYLQFWQTR